MLAAFPASAEEVWHEKLYTEWNEEEVEQILTDSPWAQTVERLAASMSRHAGAHRAAGGGPRPHAGDATQPSGGSRVHIGDITSKDLQATPSLEIRFRWVSALPVRQAIARRIFGNEASASTEAAKMILAEQEHYVLSVSGVPASAADGDDHYLKNSLTINAKGKEKLAPVHVQELPGQAEVYVFFPKSGQGGYDITPDDEFVQVELKLKAGRVRCRFDLAGMRYHGKLQI